jgi:ERCC4-type nuclease
VTACLYVTSSPNDKDLARELGSMAIVVPIPCGDCNFFGFDGLRVLVERKKIGDLANCIMGGRYLHQLQNAHEAGFERLILIHEGDYRLGADGLLEIPTYRSMMTTKSLKPRVRRIWQPVKPTIMYSRFDQFLTELHDLLGILVKRSQNVRETAAIIRALWLYYQKPPDDHQSLHQMYSGPHQMELLGKPGLVRRVSKELSGIGWERAKAVEARFKTVREMSNAGVKDWLEIDGVGKRIATSAVSQLGGKIT